MLSQLFYSHTYFPMIWDHQACVNSTLHKTHNEWCHINSPSRIKLKYLRNWLTASQDRLILGMLSTNNAGFRLAYRSPLCRYVTWLSLAVSWFTALSSHAALARVELKSTVCDLPQWAKQQGYRFIGKTLLATRSSLCGKWRLRSSTNIIIKAAMRRAAS